MAEKKQPDVAEKGNVDFKSNIKGALSFSVPLILTSCLMYEFGYYGHYNIYLGNYITAEDFVFFFFRDLRIITFYGVCAGIATVGLLFLKNLSEQSIDEVLNGFLELLTGLFDSSWFTGAMVVVGIVYKFFPKIFESILGSSALGYVTLWVFLILYALLFIYTMVTILTVDNDVKRIRKMILGVLLSMLVIPFVIGNVTASLSTQRKVTFTYKTGERMPGPNDYLIGRTKSYLFLTNGVFEKRKLQSVAYDAGDIGSILFADDSAYSLTIVSKREAPARSAAVTLPPLAQYSAGQGVDSTPKASVSNRYFIPVRKDSTGRWKEVIGGRR